MVCDRPGRFTTMFLTDVREVADKGVEASHMISKNIKVEILERALGADDDGVLWGLPEEPEVGWVRMRDKLTGTRWLRSEDFETSPNWCEVNIDFQMHLKACPESRFVTRGRNLATDPYDSVEEEEGTLQGGADDNCKLHLTDLRWMPSVSRRVRNIPVGTGFRTRSEQGMEDEVTSMFLSLATKVAVLIVLLSVGVSCFLTIMDRAQEPTLIDLISPDQGFMTPPFNPRVHEYGLLLDLGS